MHSPWFSLNSVATVLLLAVSQANAQSTASPLTTNSTTCDAACRQISQLGASWEQSQHAHTPLDPFYSVPASFSPSLSPGTLLRVEAVTDLTNYTVPSGLTMSRIMYTSLDINGTVVPVSAYALWPFTALDDFGEMQKQPQFPLVAWAHGTSGLFAACAPSNYRSLQYHFMVPYQLALEGFAVIASDYAGLGASVLANGSTIVHQYLASSASANDVAFAIEAIRKAFPERLAADGPFVTMGHSQGGAVAWGFADRQAVSPVPGYRGTVTISPAVKAVDQLTQALMLAGDLGNATFGSVVSRLPAWASTILGLQTKFIAAVTAAYPGYKLSGLTDLGYDRWTKVLASLQGCLPTDGLVFSDVPLAAAVKPQWYDDPVVEVWLNRTDPSGRQFAGPMLLLVGGDDAVLPSNVLVAADQSCAVPSNKAQSLEVVTYAAMGHFPVIQASRTKWMAWIKDRVRGHKGSARPGCGRKSVVTGFNTNATLLGQTAPNFLLEAALGESGWMLAL